ncbi:MAG: hypothetical protein ABJA67_12915 [Chthonomonadales bacterium]
MNFQSNVTTYVGEIILTSSRKMLCESVLLDKPPPFGSFVVVGDKQAYNNSDPFESATLTRDLIFGVVYHASTSSSETGRRPTAYGLEADQLRRTQPQISELLSTEFQVLIVGKVVSGTVLHRLPEKPPRLHDRVRNPEPNELLAITKDRGYIEPLLGFVECEDPDELMASAIRIAAASTESSGEYLSSCARDLVTLLHDDYDRLRRIIRKLV